MLPRRTGLIFKREKLDYTNKRTVITMQSRFEFDLIFNYDKEDICLPKNTQFGKYNYSNCKSPQFLTKLVLITVLFQRLMFHNFC